MRRIPISYLALGGTLMLLSACGKGGGPSGGPPAPDTTHRPAADDYPAVDHTAPVTTVTWDIGARKISDAAGYAEYGRVRRLNGDTLLLTYHAGPDNPNFFGVDIVVRKSTDDGNTWSPADVVVDGPEPGYYGFQNPDILVLKNGWLLLAFVGRGKPDNNTRDNVQVCISTDRGTSWSKPRVAASGRSWEPGMVQLADGTIDLFYSSEAAWFPGADVQQEILLISSSDNGQSWTSPRRVAYSPGNRDGMAVPLVLQDGKGIVFSIESVGNSKSPWIIWSSADANFNYRGYATLTNSRRWVAITQQMFGGAPYLIRLPGGETLLSIQYPGSRAIGANWKKSTAAVFVGNSMATHFTHPSTPWPGLPVDEGAYFNSLFLKNDSTPVLITTRNMADGHSEIWWKEGHLHE